MGYQRPSFALPFAAFRRLKGGISASYQAYSAHQANLTYLSPIGRMGLIRLMGTLLTKNYSGGVNFVLVV